MLHRKKCCFRVEVPGQFLVYCGCAVTFPRTLRLRPNPVHLSRPRLSVVTRREERESKGGGTFDEAVRKTARFAAERPRSQKRRAAFARRPHARSSTGKPSRHRQ